MRKRMDGLIRDANHAATKNMPTRTMPLEKDLRFCQILALDASLVQSPSTAAIFAISPYGINTRGYRASRRNER